MLFAADHGDRADYCGVGRGDWVSAVTGAEGCDVLMVGGVQGVGGYMIQRAFLEM